MLRTALLALIGFLGMVSATEAATPTPPSLKPERLYASEVVSTQDAETLHEAYKAASDGDWSRVAWLQTRARSEIVSDLILWRQTTAGAPGLGFQDLAGALERLDAWPNTSRIQSRAEELIGSSGLLASEQINWLNASGPRTGDGKVALALAFLRIGETGKALETAVDAWRNHSLERETSQQLQSAFGQQLTQADHRARVDFLLWTRQRSEASRLSPLLTPDWRALVDARIKLQAGRRGVDTAIRAVPESLQDHAGLLYDRAQWRRRRGMQSGATDLLVDIRGNDVPWAGRSRLWDERNLAVRRALKESDFRTAYRLASPHGLVSGGDFAEAEWLSGWIALRHTGDPETARIHFETLQDGVSTPISSSRALYWSGRAQAALGDRDLALETYRAASEFRYTYYGQLAAERVNAQFIAFDTPPEPTMAERSAFESRDLVQAIRLLAEAGESGYVRTFAYHLDDSLDAASDFVLLKELGDNYQFSDIGVRGAKAGLARGVVAPQAAYPVVSYPLLREPFVERSLMLALSRQESEMNPRAISHANARGLMQFVPATAALEARQRGLPYRTSWLTDDPGYNMTLGGAHLDTLLDRFNGSYIMTAAAYNAGPRRPAQWVEDYGDPRLGEIDPIDWVEFIPFSETRNYVQRVLENTQVYRHRLSGEEEEIRLSEDLERGRFN
ncbi:MAG: lytic transglycosylase domain-containing protein [Pseudomonadota bacterium]